MQVQASNKWLIASLLMVLVSLVSTGVLYLVEVLIVIVVSISQSVECFIWDGTDSLQKCALTNVSIESSPSILDPSTLTWFDAMQASKLIKSSSVRLPSYNHLLS